MDKKNKKRELEEGEVVEQTKQKKRKNNDSSAIEVSPITEKANGKPHSPHQNGILQNGSSSPNVKNDKEKSTVELVGETVPVTNFRISADTVARLAEKNIHTLFPIQHKTFDHVYDGKDLIGRARTGTGKTLAFILPLAEKLRLDATFNKKVAGRAPRIIVMAPTRELAKQIAADFSHVVPYVQTTCIYGGVPYEPQERDMYRGVDVVVGTPGRIIDHLERKNLKLSDIQYIVLDEADEMLNFGFAEDIEKILASVPKEKPHQTLLFSATIPSWVNKVAQQYLSPDHIKVDLVGSERVKSAQTIQHLAICCSRQERSDVLAEVVKVYGAHGRTIVFVDTKADATEMATNSSIREICQALHGDINQREREITLNGFKKGKFSCLVATDVAARGLDIPEVDLVIQCQPPKDPESYIHRVGRTGRAGREGTSILFYTKNHSFQLKNVERAVGIEFRRIGTPQPEDLIQVAVSKTTLALGEISKDIIPRFADFAKNIVEEKFEGDAVKALSAALALICGFTQPFKPRSLLGSVEGYTTIRIKSIRPFFSPKFVLNILSDYTSDTKEIRICDGGAVADVPSEIASKMVEKSDQLKANNPGRSVPLLFEICTELPEMKDAIPSSNGRNERDRGSGGRNERDRGSGGRYGRYGRGRNF